MNRPRASGGLLAGRTVLITGASGGVGAGMARACAAADGNVVIAARRLEVAEHLASELRRQHGHALAVRCDVTRRSEVDAAVAAATGEFGRLDSFIHNAVAELGPPGPIEAISDDIWQAQLATAVRASYYGGQAAFPHLKEVGGALTLLVSSAGILGSSAIPHYAVVKGALRGLAKSLAYEWGPSGVRVNCLAPVALSAALEFTFRTNPAAKERVLGSTPLGRVGDPEEDIGGVAVFLSSHLSRFVTGQTLLVNGGYSVPL